MTFVGIGFWCMFASAGIVLLVEKHLHRLCDRRWSYRLTCGVLNFCGGLNLFGCGLSIYGIWAP